MNCALLFIYHLHTMTFLTTDLIGIPPIGTQAIRLHKALDGERREIDDGIPSIEIHTYYTYTYKHTYKYLHIYAHKNTYTPIKSITFRFSINKQF